MQGVERAGWWALGAQVLAWYMQLHPGHKVLEGRRPALLDSFWQVCPPSTAPTPGAPASLSAYTMILL